MASNAKSDKVDRSSNQEPTSLVFNQLLDEANDKMNLDSVIHHYMPSRFPYSQVICEEDVQNFRIVWLLIYNDNAIGVGGKTRLSTLFDVFYHNLFTRSEKFRDFFGNNYKERCRVLSRQMNFFTTLKLDATLDLIFADLGKLHRRLGISNWMYAMFVEVLLESIATTLGDDADMLKMHSATRVVSFCIFHLLKNTLREENLRRAEMNVNFRDSRVENIIDKLTNEEMIRTSEKLAASIEGGSRYGDGD